MSNFPNYSGPLTETILLGNLAVYKRGKVEWDPVTLKPLNDPSLAKIVHPSTATATKCNRSRLRRTNREFSVHLGSKPALQQRCRTPT